MKHSLNRIALASSLALATAGAQAADTFVGLTWGQTNDNIQKSGSLNAALDTPQLDKIIHKTGTWGLRAGKMDDTSRYYMTYENVSGSDSGYKLRQQNLLGSFDVFLPVGDYNTRLFSGPTLGLVKLEQNSRGFRRDSDINYAAGWQAGMLQDLNKDASIEVGYRYLRTNASTDMAEHGGPRLGSAYLHSSSLAYVGANYKF